MTNMVKRQLKNERNLHKLFATHLPVVPLPADFAEHLVQSVLEEVAQHTQNRPTAGEHRLSPAPKPVSRRPLRAKRPPQALLLAVFFVCVSVLFLVSGCVQASLPTPARPQQPLFVVARPPLVPLFPHLPVTALHTQSAEMVAVATAASGPALAVWHVTTLVATAVATDKVAAPVLISQTTVIPMIGGQMAQMPAAAQAATITAPPPEEATSPPPTTPPLTASTATATISAPPTPSPTSAPINPTPQPHLFLPTVTPLPPVPTATADTLPLPSYTPVLQPLPPTPLPTP